MVGWIGMTSVNGMRAAIRTKFRVTKFVRAMRQKNFVLLSASIDLERIKRLTYD